RILHGTLDEHNKDELIELNRKGAGIFVTVNETDFKGRRKANITGVRSVWQEDDNGHGPNPLIEHNICVETSPEKYHRYYLTDSDNLDEFDSVQRRLVEDHGSDPNAKDISRVLRVPGFYHMKNPVNPHLVKIVGNVNLTRYSWAEIKKFFPPVQIEKKSAPSPHGNGILREPGKIYAALRFIDPDECYTIWLEIGMALHFASGGGQEGLNMWDAWSRSHGSIKYGPGVCELKWRTFGNGK
ncbi:PriCT-2 domain-containing protein, partial [Thermodesulfobacteriota bacterium]